MSDAQLPREGLGQAEASGFMKADGSLMSR